jgi:aryl-alcohol dehydrogenase-like predicted oxidoreductase
VETVDRRKLGKTQEQLSVVGFGGIVVMNVEPKEAEQHVATAVEQRGINYFDVAPSYGNAEERLGPALEPYRDDVFLACKTGKRDAKGAEEEFHQSLKRLRTDHLDLYQCHAVSSIADVDALTSRGGALETFANLRERGLVRHLGFSAHTEEAALALMSRFAFDTILFPINWVCWNRGGFGQRTVAAAQDHGLGILALKALAKRRWREGETRQWAKAWYSPVETPEEAALALRFTLSLPVTAAVSPGHAELLWWACDAADELAPLSGQGSTDIARRTADLAPIFPQVDA